VPHSIAIDARKLQDFGIGTYIRQLIIQLAEIDHENEYLVLTRPADRGDLPELPENFSLVTEKAPVYSLRELLAVSWRLYRLKADLYHSTHYVLPAVVPSRVVVSIHDIIHLLYPEFLPSRLALLYAQQMIRRSLARGECIITGSQNTKKDLVESFDVDPEKIRVIYPGVTDAFRERLSADQLDRWRRNLGLPQRYVLFVGNAEKPHKNLDRTLQAYARALREKDFGAALVCVGHRGASTFKIRQRAEQLGIADRVLLLGHVAEEALPAIYQGAALFLYPTLYEGFGLPVVEAMASEVAVITSDGSALKEVARGHADLVDPLDVRAMADAILHCMTDDDHRRALAKLGRRRAEEFRWRRTAEQTLAVYREVLAAGTAGQPAGRPRTQPDKSGSAPPAP
jgi:alpha-1,3-rhamnosyl/mannosyltransferase